MRLKHWFFTVAVVAMFITTTAQAQEAGTPEEAKALAEKAAAHMAQVGPEKAIADFNDPQAGFVDRDLFVVVYNPEPKIVAGYRVPVFMGRDPRSLKDIDGKEFGREILQMAESNGTGWVEYRMLNPVTKKIEMKTSYVVRSSDYTLFVGAYRR